MAERVETAADYERYADLLEDIRMARDAQYQASQEAQEARAFLAGHQWPSEDLARMQQDSRPALTFNQYGQLIHLICGTEVSNRFEPYYQPRTPDDQGGVDVFNEMVRFYRNACDAVNEESVAFTDAVNEGVGVTEIFLEKYDDPNGRIITRRVSPDEVLWDPDASRPNLLDARYVIRAKWVDEESFRAQWPDRADDFFSMLGSFPAGGAFDMSNEMPVQANRSWMYKSNEKTYEQSRRRVLVIERQHWVREPGYVYVDRQTGQMQFLSPTEAESLRAQLYMQGDPNPPVLQATERRYKREMWAGPILLEEGDNPIPMFTYQFITAFRDETGGSVTWYGLYRPGKDPQMWANKMLSQIAHIIGTNPKGSVHVEEDALSDPAKAKRDWGRPDAMIWYKSGGVSGRKMHIVPPPRVPEAAYSLADYSMNALGRLFGINPYAAGTAQDLKRTAASSVERLIEQGMLSISPVFDSLRLYRKQSGLAHMHFIKQYIEPGTMVRVVGQPSEPFVQYTKDMSFMNYDVIVEESSLQPSNMADTWNRLNDQGFLQKMMEIGIPAPPSIIDIVPGLPRHIRDEWKAYIEQMMQGQQGQEPPPE